jgi:DNA-binding NtrC family response regulator
MNANDALILVVDDEESMRHYLKKTLAREGYEVLAARDGPEALELAQQRPPDLAMVDVRMPGMDGVALMRSLRTSLPRLPIVLMTGYATVQHALSAMKQGATDYVTKPFRVDAVCATVAKALGRPEDADRPRTLRDAEPAERAPDATLPEAPVAPAANPAAAVPERGVLEWLRERAQQRGLPAAPQQEGLREVVRLAETVFVDELLRMTDGNISRASEMAGITRPNLHRKILDLGLDANTYRPGGGNASAGQ